MVLTSNGVRVSYLKIYFIQLCILEYVIISTTSKLRDILTMHYFRPLIYYLGSHSDYPPYFVPEFSTAAFSAQEVLTKVSSRDRNKPPTQATSHTSRNETTLVTSQAQHSPRRTKHHIQLCTLSHKDTFRLVKFISSEKVQQCPSSLKT
jgi:hypothetical protein